MGNLQQYKDEMYFVSGYRCKGRKSNNLYKRYFERIINAFQRLPTHMRRNHQSERLVLT